MALLRFFKVPRHQKFDYKSRFYDPRKEELEERLKQAEGVKDGDADAMKARISSGFRAKGGYQKVDNRFRRQQVKRSNMVLLGVVVLLLLLTYLIFAQYLPEFLEMMETKG